MLSSASFFILDEPFSGLDPIGIKEIKDIFKVLKQNGKTVFFNSHLLSEVEKIADNVAIISNGEIKASGTLKEIMQSSTLEDSFYNLVKGDV